MKNTDLPSAIRIQNQRTRYSEAWREANAIYEEWAAGQGLSYAELLTVLSLAQSEEGCCQRDICRQWALPKQTVNTILKNFTGRGLVELRASREDKRNKEIHLTEPGRLLAEGVWERLKSRESAVMERMGKEKAEELIRLTLLYNQMFREADSYEPEKHT